MAPINVCVIIRGELAIGRIFAPHTSHEGNWCQASIALPHRNLLPLPYWSPRQPFSQLEINYLPIVGPVELWATRLRRPSAAANPQGFCWPLRPPLARQRILPSRSPRYTATSGVDKLKRDRGSEGARHWGASSRRKLRGTIKIVIFRRALPLSNPWLEPIVDCGL